MEKSSKKTILPKGNDLEDGFRELYRLLYQRTQDMDIIAWNRVADEIKKLAFCCWFEETKE